MPDSRLDRVVVVLFEPQDQVNIGATVRAMRNMGAPTLRLVRPVPYDLNRIETIAHDSSEFVSRIQHFERLEDALADCVFVAAYTARRRAAKWTALDPKGAAAMMLDACVDGPVAVLFGREDSGLPNEALDRANASVTIPTTEHASLNLAQAVLVALYELHVQAGDATRRVARARKHAPAATAEQFERLFADASAALTAIDFFKTRNPELIMRTVRSLAYRAAPDAREIELARAMCIEVLRTIDRVRRQAATAAEGESG